MIINNSHYLTVYLARVQPSRQISLPVLPEGVKSGVRGRGVDDQDCNDEGGEVRGHCVPASSGRHTDHCTRHGIITSTLSRCQPTSHTQAQTDPQNCLFFIFILFLHKIQYNVYYFEKKSIRM